MGMGTDNLEDIEKALKDVSKEIRESPEFKRRREAHEALRATQEYTLYREAFEELKCTEPWLLRESLNERRRQKLSQ
jgi:cell fate (sporulation/competence/biofilm development) regulator YlbF (YheA/YmcA/DUF963 family)